MTIDLHVFHYDFRPTADISTRLDASVKLHTDLSTDGIRIGACKTHLKYLVVKAYNVPFVRQELINSQSIRILNIFNVGIWNGSRWTQIEHLSHLFDST